MLRTAHLFAGAGGGLLADLILGHEPVYAVDHDASRVAQLRARRDEGWFPRLKVFRRDLTTYDAGRWQGRVDSLHAGIPCPKWSSARRGRGATFDGWDIVARIVAECHPRFVFLECVANFAQEHKRVTRDLAAIGYTVGAPLLLDAAAVGAPHARRRYWALGYADNESEPVRRVDAEVAELSPPDAGVWWSADPRAVRVVDGLAPRVDVADRYRAIGNGQVPLQAAMAWVLLGGPTNLTNSQDPPHAHD